MLSVYYYKKLKRKKDRQQIGLIAKWNNYIDLKLADSCENLKMQEGYFKKLYSQEELMSFYHASLKYLNSKDEEVRESFLKFIRANKEDWLNLGLSYGKREQIRKAYFAFLCESLHINKPEDYDDITELMLEYVLEPSIYCRDNALNALYIFGNKDAVIKSFIILSKNNIIHTNKLVTDGLLRFRGNTEGLVEDIFNNLENFSLDYQVAIVDYFRFKGENLKYKLIDILKNKENHKDLICSLLRYYGKYVVKEYKSVILEWLNNSKDEDWECTSTAAITLGKYPGDDTVKSLKYALKSKNWYVRKNAASSIIELKVDKTILLDIINGEDTYAKEQLLYQYNYK